MTAYELADEIDSIAKDWLGQNKSGQLANMLRQQADRIAELEKDGKVCATCGGLVYDPVLKQTKPLPEGLIDPKSYYIGYEDGKKAPQTKPLSNEEITKLHLKCWDEIEFARAIEERHGIK